MPNSSLRGSNALHGQHHGQHHPLLKSLEYHRRQPKPKLSRSTTTFKLVKIYGSVKSACTQRVFTCLLEVGAEFELMPIDLDSGEHKQPEFLLRQPFGQVPAIEEGEFKLFESRAIVRYYAAKYKSDLLGTTLEENALVDQWLEVESQNFNEMVYTIVLQLMVFPKMGQSTDTALVQKSKNKLEKVLDIYEERLSKSKYLAGDFCSLADLSHLPGIRYLMNEAGMGELVTERKSVNLWWVEVSNRPSWKKVMLLME